MPTTRTERRSQSRFRPSRAGHRDLSPAARRSRGKFLRFFPGGFLDETYLDWERNYKWEAHERWSTLLRRSVLRSLLDAGEYETIARHAVAIESRTNLLFSFEKMAVRDAVKDPHGARRFAEGLWDFLHGSGGSDQERFEAWADVIAGLPRRGTRVLTWPVLTVWGFVAAPQTHVFLKPNVTRRAAEVYGVEFDYRSRPDWATYASLLEFTRQVREDQQDLAPRDMIDLQSFIWVQGSDEYD